MIELKSKSPEELAAEIVLLPDGHSFALKSEKELAGLLTVVRDPLRYAAIFKAVAERQDASDWMRFAARSEDINGRRRAKGAIHSDVVQELTWLARDAEQKLKNSMEKYALLGGVYWNTTILNRNLRRYAEAAVSARLSASWFGLAGDTENHFVSLFEAQVEEVTFSFGKSDNDAVRDAVVALAIFRDYIKLMVGPYPLWMVQNAQVHIASAAMMAYLRGVRIDLDAYADDFRDSATQTVMPHWANVFVACEHYRAGRYQEVVGIGPVDVSSSSADNAELARQIVIAYAERELQRAEKSRERFEAVAHHRGPNGGMLIAVAEAALQ